MSKAIGRFLLALSQAPAPRKLFTTEEDAARWLRGFLRRAPGPSSARVARRWSASAT
ncbi:hypothetical protein WME92_19510 [Sorangium sp. So ce307]|uniref:hypothetical protein n=1 Tax=Sorangium cellulosum TaxID=56 RepID=UPI003D9C2CBA